MTGVRGVDISSTSRTSFSVMPLREPKRFEFFLAMASNEMLEILRGNPARRAKFHLTGNQMVAYVGMPDHLDAVFKALADQSRRELLDRLRAASGQTLGQLCGSLDMSRQAVSKHLGLLEAANLVATVKRGREKLHYLNPVPIHEIAERWIGKFERSRLQVLSELKKNLEAKSGEE